MDMNPSTTPLTPSQQNQIKAEISRAWLLVTVHGLVDDTESVKLNVETPSEGASNFVVTVSPADIGKIIGKSGRTARCIRTLLAARSMKDKVRYTLDIQEPPRAAATGSR